MAVLCTGPGLLARVKDAIARAAANNRKPTALWLSNTEWLEFKESVSNNVNMNFTVRGTGCFATNAFDSRWRTHAEHVGSFQGVPIYVVHPEYHPRPGCHEGGVNVLAV